MAPSILKNVISFVAHDNSEHAQKPGDATPMKLRIKLENDAVDFKAALDKELEEVKNK